MTLAQKTVAALNPVLRRYVEGAERSTSPTCLGWSSWPKASIPARWSSWTASTPTSASGVSAAAPRSTRARGSSSTPSTSLASRAVNGGAGARDQPWALEREITATFLEAEQNERTEKELN